MRNIEAFPSEQMYPYLSLVERKEAEFYHNIDRRRYLVWFKWLISTAFSRQFMVSLDQLVNGIQIAVKLIQIPPFMGNFAKILLFDYFPCYFLSFHCLLSVDW